MKTDLTAKEMIALGRIAPEIMEIGIESQVLPGKNQKIDGLWYWVPDTDQINGISDVANKSIQVAVEELND